jgi:phosphate/sulfate permease
LILNANGVLSGIPTTPGLFNFGYNVTANGQTVTMAAGHDGLPQWMTPTGSEVPRWVIIVCAAAIGLGTMAGGRSFGHVTTKTTFAVFHLDTGRRKE